MRSRPPRPQVTHKRLFLRIKQGQQLMGGLYNTSTNVSESPPLLFVVTVFSVTLSVAPARDSENKVVEPEQTVAPPSLDEKRPPVVSAQHVPLAGGISSISSTSKPAAVRPQPERTEQEDVDYDSDDASRDFIFRNIPIMWK